jgi:hypothetical protein
VRWLDPAAPWATAIGATPTGSRSAPALAVRASLLYDDRAAQLHHVEEWEAVVFPLGATLDPASVHVVDHDPRDLRGDPPPGATYVLTDVPLDRRAWFADAERALAAHLQRSRTVSLPRNRALGLVGRPGESDDAFAARCAAAAEAEADRAEVALRKKYETRVDRARDAIEVARDRLEQLEAARTTRRSEELLTGAGSLLDAFLGGRRSARRIARSVSGAASRRGRASEAATRVDAAGDRVQAKLDALADLEADLAEELAAIDDTWSAKATDVERVDVPLEKGDITFGDVTLVWVPVG